MQHAASGPTSELTEDERDALRRLVANHGTVTMAKRTETSRDVIARAVAGLPLRRGTVVLLRLTLKREAERKTHTNTARARR